MEKETSRRKYRNPLNLRVFVGCLLCVLLLSAALSTAGFVIFRNRMMSQYETHLGDVLRFAEARVDVADLKTCIETLEESEKFKELVAFCDQARVYYDLEDIVITKPVKEGDSYDVILVLSGLYPEERNGQKQKNIDIPFLGDRMGAAFPPGFVEYMYNQFMGSHEIEYSVSDNEYGHTYNASTTIRDKNGIPVAQLSAGMTMDFIESTMRKYIINVICATVLLSVLIVALMMIWMRKSVLNPIAAIERAAKDFDERSKGEKNPNALVMDLPKIKTGDEIESLSESLTSMTESMKTYVVELLESAVKMDIMELDLEESKRKAMKMSELAVRDTLTGIRNKTGYNNEVEKTSEKLADGNKFFGVAIADLNGLTQINDSYGYDKGDAAIRKLSGIMCAVFDHSPVFRIGGDEFVAILRGSDYDNSSALVEKFNREIEGLCSDDSLAEWERTSAAIGFALYDDETDKCYDDVFVRADRAMYEHKARMKADMESEDL